MDFPTNMCDDDFFLLQMKVCSEKRNVCTAQILKVGVRTSRRK
jgi:hypothetical protein